MLVLWSLAIDSIPQLTVTLWNAFNTLHYITSHHLVHSLLMNWPTVLFLSSWGTDRSWDLTGYPVFWKSISPSVSLSTNIGELLKRSHWLLSKTVDSSSSLTLVCRLPACSIYSRSFCEDVALWEQVMRISKSWSHFPNRKQMWHYRTIMWIYADRILLQPCLCL